MASSRCRRHDPRRVDASRERCRSTQVSNLHKSTDKVFSDVVEKLHKHVHPKTKKPASLIADDVYEVIMYVSRRPRITPKIGKRPPATLSPGDDARRRLASRETAAITRNRRRSNKDKINGAIVYDRDFEYDYFGFKTLERSYLMRCDGDIAERPQHMIMRVAIGIHGSDVDAASSNRAQNRK